MTAGRAALPSAVAALLGCAGYEAAVAAGAIDLGAQPGEGPTGGGLVLALALLALFAGGGLLAAGVRSAVAPLVPPAAVAFVLARFLTYDPYYAPTLRRMSDHGLVSPVWIAALGVSALVAALLLCRRSRGGGPLAAVLLLLAALTALGEGAGH
jgi:hypothetical protein